MSDELTARMKQLRTKRHLQAAPDMVAHILTLVTSTGGGGGDKVSGGSDPQRLPLNASALEDANGLYAKLIKWAIGHSIALNLVPPAITLGWLRKETSPDGFPSWATRTDAYELLKSVTDWLIAAEHHIASRSIAVVYYDDVQEIIGPLYGRYPIAPPRPRFASRECLVCGKHTVIVNFGDDGEVSVACTYCGHPVPASAHESYLEEKA